MKKTMVFGALLFMCVGLFAQNVSLDQAIQTSTQAIETRLPKGAKTAVLTFTSAKQAFSDYIIDELATALSLSRNIQLIDRQHTDAIRKEFNIQFSGDVSDDEVKRIGHQLGAQYVVTGSLVDVGNAYRFRVAAINIETNVREGSPPLNININDPQVTFLLTGQRPTQIDTTPSNSEKVYKVGDIGPAGGIIFYDRGFVSDGWRYLEAAPAEAEFEASWDRSNRRVNGTATGIGTGKINTVIIVRQLGNRNAAGLCSQMNFGGYTDWFMPSRDELGLMYVNLKERNLGGFTGEYSSSSQSTPSIWGQNFRSGNQSEYYGKENPRLVRAVRAF